MCEEWQPYSCGILPPSLGRRCPEGAEVGWGKRDEREGRFFQVRHYTEAPSHSSLAASHYTSHFLRFHTDDTKAGEAQDGEAPA